MDRYRVITGDCLDVLAMMDAASVDAVVTDPPYELAFMGKRWDASGIAFRPETWAAVLRVLKPGGHLLAFGGTRTSHRMVCAIEDAGWEVRDSLVWLHGQGFPKGHSQMKPAHEPICLARKPLVGTVAANVAAWGTGALNVAGCRIGTSGGETHSKSAEAARGNGVYGSWGAVETDRTPRGRWPANVVLSHTPDCQQVGTRRVKASAGGVGGKFGSSHVYAQDAFTKAHIHPERTTYADADGLETVAAWQCAPGCPVAALDEQSGERPSKRSVRVRPGSVMENGQTHGRFVSDRDGIGGYDDTGGASRFFYCAKASTAERNQGLAPGERSTHPTVKPLALMCWLVRLVTPPGGLVLDPFTGSGTTGLACLAEDFRFVGIEQDAGYADLARRRITAAVGPLFAQAGDD